MHTPTKKIFGLGLSKTGTTSLAKALTILGYKTRDCMGLTRFVPGDVSCVELQELETHDAFTDTPIPSFYRELDLKYPGSKFILTIRDEDGWKKSCKKQFNQNLKDKQNSASKELFKAMYGDFVYHEENYPAGYKRYVEGVLQHFKQRPGDLLVMNVAAGDGWEKLCPFLGKPVPELPFPKSNVTRHRWMDMMELVSLARKAGLEVLQTGGLTHLFPSPMPRKHLRDNVRYLWKNLKIKALMHKMNPETSASRASLKIITKRLGELTPGVPIISRERHSFPYRDRRMWNHFWLVDPMDAPGGLSGDPFTVNIALIEERVPSLGVVYAPLSDTVYYGKSGKGAFRITGTKPPQPISKDSDISKKDAGPETVYISPPCSLEMCRSMAEGRQRAFLAVSQKEWQAAAAHSIAIAAGMRVVERKSREEITYNRKDFKLEPFTIE